MIKGIPYSFLLLEHSAICSVKTTMSPACQSSGFSILNVNTWTFLSKKIFKLQTLLKSILGSGIYLVIYASAYLDIAPQVDAFLVVAL